MRALIFSVLMLGACASTHETEVAGSAEPVIAAERAFAARGAEIGWIPAFREYTAPDGQFGELQNAPEQLAATPDDGARNLFWWPAFAGIARSGDLGFTTGPFSVDDAHTPRGQYFTVWRKQPDGSWKWIWDGGPGPRPDPLNHGVDVSPVPMLPIAQRGVGSADEAAHQIAALENNASAAALAAYLASDAQVYRSGRPSASAAAESFIFPNGEVRYTLRRTEASAAGDLVFTLGEASWTRDGAERQGFFARIWQYRPEGWRIVYDQLVGRAPPPAQN